MKRITNEEDKKMKGRTKNRYKTNIRKRRERRKIKR